MTIGSSFRSLLRLLLLSVVAFSSTQVQAQALRASLTVRPTAFKFPRARGEQVQLELPAKSPLVLNQR